MEYLDVLLEDIGRLEVEKYLNKGYTNFQITHKYELDYIG